MRIFLDANILFSAVKSDGAIQELLNRLLASGHELCADEFVTEEARRNLALKAPQRVEGLGMLLARLQTAAAQSDDPSLSEGLVLPEKDRPVLAAAIRLRCDALVTGDRTHFGVHYGKVVAGVAIHSPRSLADALKIGR